MEYLYFRRINYFTFSTANQQVDSILCLANCIKSILAAIAFSYIANFLHHNHQIKSVFKNLILIANFHLNDYRKTTSEVFQIAVNKITQYNCMSSMSFAYSGLYLE